MKLILFALIAFGCTRSYPEFDLSCSNEPVNKYLIMSIDSTRGISSSIPRNWPLVSSSEDGWVFSDVASMKVDSIVRMLSIRKEPLEGNLSFDEFIKNSTEAAERAIKQNGEEYTFRMEDFNYNWNGKRVFHSRTVDSSKPNVVTTTSQFYISNENVLFVLTIGTWGDDIYELECKYSGIITTVKKI